MSGLGRHPKTIPPNQVVVTFSLLLDTFELPSPDGLVVENYAVRS